jgi:LysM repeat protein
LKSKKSYISCLRNSDDDDDDDDDDNDDDDDDDDDNNNNDYDDNNDNDYANDNGIPQIIGTTKTYKVKSGDTLSKIAVDNKTSVSEIKRLNNLTSDTIKINQVLIVN